MSTRTLQETMAAHRKAMQPLTEGSAIDTRESGPWKAVFLEREVGTDPDTKRYNQAIGAIEWPLSFEVTVDDTVVTVITNCGHLEEYIGDIDLTMIEMGKVIEFSSFEDLLEKGEYKEPLEECTYVVLSDYTEGGNQDFEFADKAKAIAKAEKELKLSKTIHVTVIEEKGSLLQSRTRRLMKLPALVESYARENSWLLEYLTEKPFETFDVWHLIEDESEFTDACERLGIDFSSLDDDDKLDACHKIDAALTEHEKDALSEYLMENDPTEAPTWAFFLLNSKRLLPPSTWLVHFTDDPENIATGGFRFGCDDLRQLGLTRWKTNKARTQRPGWNFAFKLGENESKYGDSCVVFQSSGVDAWHSGDEEDQVIFFGPSITTRPIAINETSEGFEVLSTKGDRLFINERCDAAQQWIVDNFAQYRSKLLK